MSESGGLQPTIPPGSSAETVVAADSGNVAAAAAVATLPAAAGKITYITGYTLTGLGATAAALVAATITGPAQTITVPFAVPAGVTVPCAGVYVELPIPVPGAAVNTAVAVNLPSLGAGNTNARATAHGYQA